MRPWHLRLSRTTFREPQMPRSCQRAANSELGPCKAHQFDRPSFAQPSLCPHRSRAKRTRSSGESTPQQITKTGTDPLTTSKRTWLDPLVTWSLSNSGAKEFLEGVTVPV